MTTPPSRRTPTTPPRLPLRLRQPGGTGLLRLRLAHLHLAPSRLSAEAPDRAERQALLDAVARNGFMTGYRGLRIASTGRRFWIEDGIVWELLDGTASGAARPRRSRAGGTPERHLRLASGRLDLRHNTAPELIEHLNEVAGARAALGGGTLGEHGRRCARISRQACSRS